MNDLQLVEKLNTLYAETDYSIHFPQFCYEQGRDDALNEISTDNETINKALNNSYQQGRADAIEEFLLDVLDFCNNNCWETSSNGFKEFLKQKARECKHNDLL